MGKYWKRKEEDTWSEVQAAIQRSNSRKAGDIGGSFPDYSKPVVAKPACHKPPAEEIAGRGIYITASTDLVPVLETVQPRLILDCRNLSTVQLTITSPATLAGGPRSLGRIVARHIAKPPAIIRIAWPDYGLPPLGPKFFCDIAAWLRGQPVVCICMGGHGRSGTAAASLLAGYGVTAEAAVAAVRRDHCGCAIENKKQEGFVGAVAEARRARR